MIIFAKDVDCVLIAINHLKSQDDVVLVFYFFTFTFRRVCFVCFINILLRDKDVDGSVSDGQLIRPFDHISDFLDQMF